VKRATIAAAGLVTFTVGRLGGPLVYQRLGAALLICGGAFLSPRTVPSNVSNVFCEAAGRAGAADPLGDETRTSRSGFPGADCRRL
jgi:hypothetical protein